MSNKKNISTKGFILLFSLLVSSIILAAGLSVTRIIIRQIYLASVQRDSQMAFFAADSGIECARYWKQETIPVAGATCNGIPLKKVVASGTRSLLTDLDKTQNNIVFSFDTGGGDVGGIQTVSNCVVITLCKDATGTGECKDPVATNGKIVARGYNVPCDTTGNPSGGRVVERKLVYRYR